MHQAEAYIFDFYGTLVEIDRDTPPMWQLLEGMGYNSSPILEAIWESDAFDGTITPRWNDDPNYEDWRRNNLRAFVRHSGVPSFDIENVIERLLEVDRSWTVKSIPPASEILVKLKQSGKKIGLCSNWDYPIQSYLEQAAFTKFDGITVSIDVGARKPHVKMFEDICFKLDVSPQEAVFIGDRWSTDVIGALRAGLIPVWIRKGQAPSTVEHVLQEFDSLTEFKVWLEKHLV